MKPGPPENSRGCRVCGRIAITSPGCGSRTLAARKATGAVYCGALPLSTALPPADAAAGAAGHTQQELHFETALTEQLQNLARRQQVTLNTVVQGAWGLLLSRYSREGDVVFGATVSGRPAELPGVESMVGLFINTLPVRVELRDDESVSGLLRRVQAQQAESRQYEYSPLAEIQTWSDCWPRSASVRHPRGI